MLIFHCPELKKGEQIPYSYRSRAYLPSNHLNSLYGESKVISNLEKEHITPNDVVVLGKKHNNVNVRHLTQRGIKFIFDVADDKWDLLGDIWDRTLKVATGVTTTCPALADIIKTRSDRIARVIPDPTEREQEKPKFRVKPPVLKIVYYGNESNYRQLKWKSIETIVKNSYHTVQFDWVINKWWPRPSNPEKHPHWKYGDSPAQREILLRDHQNHYDRIIDWSFEKQGQMVRDADLVLLPINPEHRMTRGKGNNRPIDAIRQGRFVITTPGCPSFDSLSKYIYIGQIHNGIKWAVENPEEVLRKIKKGQAMIKDQLKGYEVGIVAEKWRKYYQLIMDGVI